MERRWQVLTATERAGWLARLDPRAKLAWSICCFGLAVAVHGPVSLAAIGLALLLVSWRGGILPGVGRALRALLWLVVVVALLDVAYFGLEGGLIAAAKLVLGVASLAMLLQSTPPEDLSAGLRGLGVPYSFAFTLAAGARFVPTVAGEAATIRDAYRARGVPLDETLAGRLRALVRVMVPLVVATTARSVRLAEAMEARAFGLSPTRTPLRELSFARDDWLLIGLAVGLTTVVVFLETGI